MNSVLRVSASTGTLLPRPDEVPNRWAFVMGERNVGRFSLHSSRSKPLAGSTDSLSSAPAVGSKPAIPRKPKTGEKGTAKSKASDAASALPRSSKAGATNGESDDSIPSVADSNELAIEVDTQVMQLTLKASHPQALPTEVARLRDVLDIFGQVSMQACLTEQSVCRTCYRLVGRAHDITHWPSKDSKLPLLDATRAYYPGELHPSEKIWLPSVFEPVRRTYLLFPKPLEIFLQEEPVRHGRFDSGLSTRLLLFMMLMSRIRSPVPVATRGRAGGLPGGQAAGSGGCLACDDRGSNRRTPTLLIVGPLVANPRLPFR